MLYGVVEQNADHFPGAIELGDGDTLDGEDVLPGFRLPVADVFL